MFKKVPTARRRVNLSPLWLLFSRRYVATVICLLAIGTLISGFAGFVWQHNQSSNPLDWSIPIFQTAQLFLLNSGVEEGIPIANNGLLVVARLCAATLFVVISGAVIRRVLADVLKQLKSQSLTKHTVICGLGQVGTQILEDLAVVNRAERCILIERNPDHPGLDRARRLGAVVMLGDATLADLLRDARVTSADEIFVVTGDDSINLEIAAEISRLFEQGKVDRQSRPLHVYIHILDTHFATSLRPYSTALQGSPHVHIQVFNVPQLAATKLVTEQLWEYAPRGSDEVAHFVLLGFGGMGQALALQLAQLAHFPNHKRSRFTIADQDIDKLALPFLCRFGRFTSWTHDASTFRPGLSTFEPQADHWDFNDHPLPNALRIDSEDAIQYVCNAQFWELPAGRANESFAIKLIQEFVQPSVKPSIFICGQDDHDNFERAVQLRELLVCQGRAEIPIFVWLPHQPALADTLTRTNEGNFFPFGECQTAASYIEITKPLREIVGQKIHDDYERRSAERAEARGETYSIQSWPAIPHAFRESSKIAADHMLIKLQYVGVKLTRKDAHSKRMKFQGEFYPETKQTLAIMEHYRWVAERLLAGWRYCPKGTSPEMISKYKKRKLNHNLTLFEKSEVEKDFDQIESIYQACQQLENFVLQPHPKRLDAETTRG